MDCYTLTCVLYFEQAERLEMTYMNRAELERFILENYNAEPDFPWMKYPNYEVFRHSNNQKVVCADYGCPQRQTRAAGLRPFGCSKFQVRYTPNRFFTV